MINELVDAGKVDSPVYAFLPRLHAWITAVTPVMLEAGTVPPAAAVAVADQTATVLMDIFRDAKKKSDWPLTESLLRQLLARRPSDPYLTQQLAITENNGNGLLIVPPAGVLNTRFNRAVFGSQGYTSGGGIKMQLYYLSVQ